MVDALFIGDLDDVPHLIDLAVQNGADVTELTEAAAWMFVIWAALEQQREGCLGWRQIHERLDGAWGSAVRNRWSIGQIFRPKIEQHALAREMADLYTDNIKRGVDKLKDMRTIKRFERQLRRLGHGWLRHRNEKAILAAFGQNRIGLIPELLQGYGEQADAYNQHYLSLLTGPDGESRAGQRADMLVARISAVHRTAIVCARTCHLATLAAKAKTTDDLRAMLDAPMPEVLSPQHDKQPRPDKERLRQLLHVVRIEFLQDGEHLPKCQKGAVEVENLPLPLELSEEEKRRGHEIFDYCWAELNNQPSDWRFATPLGWQCNKLPRKRLSAGN